MRKIKFRAWNKEHNRMEYNPECPSPFCNTRINNCFNFDRLVIMQYTGLKDKNGKEIYEGDIVSYGKFDLSEKSGYKKWEVIWEGVEFKLKAIDNLEKLRFDKLKSIIILGNIFENPELLKV